MKGIGGKYIVNNLLLTFVTIAEHKNFTKAADLLHLTQSAVSREIKVLEGDYGVKLFERTNKYVRLTKAGEILYHHAKGILTQYERAHRLIDDLTYSATGVLTVGSGYTFGEYVLPWIIQNFKTSYPAITPKITIKNSDRIAAQVLRHELDIGIVEGCAETKGLLAQPFAEDELEIIVPPSHRLAKRETVNLEDFEDDTWILREVGSGTRNVTNRIFSEVRFTPASMMEFGSSQVIKESVEAGLGVSLISRWAVRKETRFGILCALKIRGESVKREFSYVLPQTQFHTRVTELFIEHITKFTPQYSN